MIDTTSRITFDLERFVNTYQLDDKETTQALIDIIRAKAVRGQRPSNVQALVTWNLYEVDHNAQPQDRFFTFLKNSLEDSWTKLLCDNKGSESVGFRISSMWGAIYQSGDWADYHTHGPSRTSWVYYLQADPQHGSPLVFDNTGYEIMPTTGQLIMFPSWLGHSVPKFIPGNDSERIVLAGNVEIQ
jgi:hypothetical protein